MTKYEKEIFAIVNTSHQHLTAEQIYQTLKESFPTVALATVYNNLNRLLEEGLIRKVITEKMPDRYDRQKKHDHLVCPCCGRLTDIRFGDLTPLLEEQLGEMPLHYDLKVYALCPDCRAQAPADEK
ncbi:MAG: Fur family transcriptional regulator [Faecalibacterium sp.]